WSTSGTPRRRARGPCAAGPRWRSRSPPTPRACRSPCSSSPHRAANLTCWAWPPSCRAPIRRSGHRGSPAESGRDGEAGQHPAPVRHDDLDGAGAVGQDELVVAVAVVVARGPGPGGAHAVERAGGAQAAGGAPEDQDPPPLAVLVPAAEGEVVAAVAVEVAGGDRTGGAAERRGAAVAVVDGQFAVDGGRLGLVAGLVVAAAVVADRDVPGAVAVEVAERGRQPVGELAARPFQPAGPGAEQPGGGLLTVVGLVDDQARRPPAVDPVGGQPPELLARRRRLDGPAGRFPVAAERAVEDDQLRRGEAAFGRGRHRHVRDAVAVEVP